MTTKRALGTETEFGIATRDSESVDPVSNSLFLINHYPSFPSPKILWDYENENPLLDIRGFEVEGERERPGPDYNRLLNKVLANGGRLYVDGAHPEYSTPECTTARGVVLYEKAGSASWPPPCAPWSWCAGRAACWCTRTTRTARATVTGIMRTTWWPARSRSSALRAPSSRSSSPARSTRARGRSGRKIKRPRSRINCPSGR